MKFTKRDWCWLGAFIGGLVAHASLTWRSEWKINRLEELLEEERVRADACENAAIANKKFYENLIKNYEKHNDQ